MKWNELSQYIVLICVLACGLFAFYYVRPNGALQFIVGAMTTIAYVLWGIIHHVAKKDLHTRVVVEYILIGAIAIVLLATILKT
jgi:hypothetical protein